MYTHPDEYESLTDAALARKLPVDVAKSIAEAKTQAKAMMINKTFQFFSKFLKRKCVQ